MYYLKLVTLKFDFKIDIPRDLLALKKLNTGHSTRNSSKVTCGFNEEVNCANLLFNIHCETAQI